MRIAKDKEVGFTEKKIKEFCEVKHFIGRAIEQTHEFLNEEIQPILKKYEGIATFVAEVKL